MSIMEKRYTAGFQKDKYLEESLTIQDGITKVHDQIGYVLDDEEAGRASAGTIDVLELWDIKELKLREIVKSEVESALRPIQRQLNEITQFISQEIEQEIITIRDVSYEQAKSEIEELFRNAGDNLYFSDIVEQLRLDLELVVSICNELLDEGKIEYGDEGAHTI